MEKENKLIIITKAIKKQIKLEQLNFFYNFCWEEKKTKKNDQINKALQKKPNVDVYIYDETYNKKQKNAHKQHVKDHINKTGTNPLIGESKKFIDISNLYVKHKEAIITTCLGKSYYKRKKRIKNPSTDIGIIAIWCKSKNHEIKINGILINIIKKEFVKKRAPH